MMKTIGMIGAMPSELADVQERLRTDEIVKKAGFSFHVFRDKTNDFQIVSVCSGVSKVNAALCAQVLIDTFSPDAILNIGVAGGIQDAVHVCDIVIATEVLPHDLDLHFLEDYPPYCGRFPADERLISLAEETCTTFGYNAFRGRIVSGEVFLADDEKKADILARYNPYAVDMESAAVGHCAYLNAVPFVSIRCISDNADDEGELSFDTFEKIAARRVAEIALAMAEKI